MKERIGRVRILQGLEAKKTLLTRVGRRVGIEVIERRPSFIPGNLGGFSGEEGGELPRALGDSAPIHR